MGELHGGCVGVAINRDNFQTETHRFQCDLAAELAGTEQ